MGVYCLYVGIQDPAVKNLVKIKFPQVHYILMREHILMRERTLMREHVLIHVQVHYMQHIDHSPLGKANPGESDNYYKIARHYGWGFKQVLSPWVSFDTMGLF